MRTFRTLASCALCALALAAHAAKPFSTPSGAFAGVRTYGFLHNLNPAAGDVLNSGGGDVFETATQMDMASDAGMAYSGSGQAHASLYTGKIGAATSLSKNDDSGTSYPYMGPSVQSYAVGRVWDTVAFDSTRLTRSIPLRVALDGQATGDLGDFYNPIESWANVHLWVYDLNNAKYVVNYGSEDASSNIDYDAFIPADAFDAGSPRRFQIGYEIEANSYIGGGAGGTLGTAANFLHTLQFEWNLPTGLTYASNSGLFNPGSVQAVPEPGAFAALAIGGLGLLKRRRR